MSTNITVTIKKLPQLAYATAAIYTLGTITLSYLVGNGYVITGCVGLVALGAAAARVVKFCGTSVTVHTMSRDVD